MIISYRARNIQESPIRKLAALSVETKKRGIQVYHLNIGQPDIATPDVFLRAIADFSERVLSYGPSDGLEILKEAMIRYFSQYHIDLEKRNIVIATGGSEAISFAFSVVSDPGDEIIVSEPFYTNYNGYATLAGVKLVPVTASAETGFHLPDIGEFEKRITSKTRAVLLCSPNNPTGTVYTPEEIHQVGELAKRHKLFLIADEVYKEFTYDGKSHFSVLQLPGMEEKTIMVDSISKRYSACGARIGAVISRNEEVMKAVLKFAQARLCPPTLEQIGAVAAYDLPLSYFRGVMDEYQQRRDVLYSILTSHPQVVLQKPEGAFYIMAKLPVKDADHFARWLLSDFHDQKETVMVAPGNGFYSSPDKGHQEIRLAYVLEKNKLERAGQLLIRALEQYNG